MSARTRYSDPSAFRMALEQRLRADARASRLPLNRLRKEAAFNRLLTRLQRAAPGMWALKGGLSLIARVGLNVRATKDADVNWRKTVRELDEVLSAVEEFDIDDWFDFEIGDGHQLRGEGEDGALRYRVTSRLGGRVFEPLSLDLNVVGPADPRPAELVTFRRNAFDFVGEPALVIPMITPAHQLAEKLHAYTRVYDGAASSRAKDLFDMLVIVDQVLLPRGAETTSAVKQTFRLRTTDWPPTLPAPPEDWADAWRGFVTDYPVPWENLRDADIALKQFWEPVLSGTAYKADAAWDRDEWRWRVPTRSAERSSTR